MHISRAEALLVLGWQVLRGIVALSATWADHFQVNRLRLTPGRIERGCRSQPMKTGTTNA